MHGQSDEYGTGATSPVPGEVQADVDYSVHMTVRVSTDGSSDLAEREAAWAKYPDEAREIPPGTTPRPCSSRKCNLLVWDGLTKKNGRANAFDVKPDGALSGTSHWRTCRDRDRFRR